jgi:hypothetical protein
VLTGRYGCGVVSSRGASRCLRVPQRGSRTGIRRGKATMPLGWRSGGPGRSRAAFLRWLRTAPPGSPLEGAIYPRRRGEGSVPASGKNLADRRFCGDPCGEGVRGTGNCSCSLSRVVARSAGRSGGLPSQPRGHGRNGLRHLAEDARSSAVNLKDWALTQGIHPQTAYKMFREGTLPVTAQRVGPR